MMLAEFLADEVIDRMSVTSSLRRGCSNDQCLSYFAPCSIHVLINWRSVRLALLGGRRRHDGIRIMTDDPLPNFGCGHIARHDPA